MTQGAERPRLVVASRNRDKLAVIRQLIGDLATVAAPPQDISLEPEETDVSLAANAAEKARHVSRQLPEKLVIATDGGLEIPALGAAWTPARTRRFAGEEATSTARIARLLALTARLSGDERAIGWREAMAVARDGQVLASWEESGPPGRLVDTAPRADSDEGFWVPAVWSCPECDGKLLRDLSPEERARRRDHWTRLGERLREFLRDYPA